MRIIAAVFASLLISNLANCQAKEISVIDFSQSECEPDRDEPKRLRDRIIKKSYQNRVLTVEVGAWAICL